MTGSISEYLISLEASESEDVNNALAWQSGVLKCSMLNCMRSMMLYSIDDQNNEPVADPKLHISDLCNTVRGR